jgi:hypothetical protein
MIPMLDPMMMMPEATMLLVVSPSLIGVMLAFVVAAAIAAVGTARELGSVRRPRAPKSEATRSSAAAPLPA